MYQNVEFFSEGARLQGRLYLNYPKSKNNLIIIMAHGFSATINGMVADCYAESFYDAGFNVLLYDHRNFGMSGGEPRQQINKWVQARGYRDAIEFVSHFQELCGNKIVLWGDSLSAAEIIAVAAIDDRVKGLIAQVPAFGDQLPVDDLGGTQFELIRETLLHGNVEGDPEKMVGPMPVVSFDPQTIPSLLLPVTAYRWFIEYGGRFETGWVNNATIAVPDVPSPLNPVHCISHIKAALLMVVAKNDEMEGANSEIAMQAYNRAPEPKRLVEVEGGHFGILYYPSKEFEFSSQQQIAFLKDYLIEE